MVNSIIGAGIFGLPSLLAARLGGYSVVASLLSGIGMLVIAGCIAEVSSRFEKTGGLYLYAREGLGRFAGLLVGWLIWLTRIAAPAAAADLFATYAGLFFPGIGGRAAEIAVIAVLLGHLAVINYLGVKMGKVVSNVFTAVKVGILAIFILSGLSWLAMHPEMRVPFSFASVPAKNWFEALLLLVFCVWRFRRCIDCRRRIEQSEKGYAICVADGARAAVLYLHRSDSCGCGDVAGRRRVRTAARRCGAAFSWKMGRGGDRRCSFDFNVWIFECESASFAADCVCACGTGRFSGHAGANSSTISNAALVHPAVCGNFVCVRGAG